MPTKILIWLAIPALALVATWPSAVAYYVLLGFSACVAALWTIQSKRANKQIQKPAYATASPRVKYEN